MNEQEERNLILNRAAMIGLIYLLNLTVIGLSYWDVAEKLSHAFGLQGPYRQWVSVAAAMSVMGFFVGEMGCLALWFNISTSHVGARILIYLLVFLHVIFFAVWATGESFAIELVLLPFVVASGFLALTSVAQRLSTGTYRLLPISQEAEGLSHGGITIAQIVYATTVLAIGLGLLSAGMLERPSTLAFIMVLTFVVCSVGLLPTAGLLSATSLKSLPLQFLVCLITSGSIAAILAWSIRPPGPPGPPGSTGSVLLPIAYVLTWLSFLPALWVRVLKRFGYVIRFFERHPKPIDVHPFKEDDTGWDIE